MRNVRLWTVVLAAVLVVAVAGTAAYGWLGNRPVSVEKTGFLMTSTVTVKVYTLDRSLGKDALEAAFEEAQRLEHLLEPLKGDGDVHRVNTSPYGTSVKVGPECIEILDYARRYYDITGGGFDPTIAAVKWLWQFDGEGRIPVQQELDAALATVGLEHVVLTGDSLTLETPGTKIDFGGIAQGYVVDRMVRVLRDRGIESALVNVSGDIYHFGVKPGNAPWIVGLRHPRNDTTLVLKTVPYPAVVTSGDYERCFYRDGIRYHHILDPRTGYPTRGCTSVTIWADSAVEADALSTALFVLGPEKGLALAERLDRVEALIYYEDQGELKLLTTSGVKDVIDQ